MKFPKVILIPLVLLGMISVHFWGAYLGTIGMAVEHFCPGLIRTNSWVSVLDDDPSAYGYSIYGILEKRRTDAAVEYALEHIHSDDAYLWLNAASYLGSRERKEAIPYLIKAIRHTAWRSVDKRVDHLQHLTGQSLGRDFHAWKKWYMSTSPDVIPDWDESLGHSPSI